MNFYDPDNRQFARRYLEEAQMVFSAMDCLLNGQLGFYCSSELTSGRRVFEALRAHGVKSVSELNGLLGEPWFKENILARNVYSACEFAKEIEAHLDPHAMVITPAPFVVEEWNQTEYLSFWETLLRSRVKAVCFNQNWEYSNGCTFEFAVALDAGLPTFDQRGEVLLREQAIELVERAVLQLESESFDTAKLRQNLTFMLTAPTEAKFAEHEISHSAFVNPHHI